MILKNNPATSALTVVLVTVQSVDCYKIVELEIGADDYIVKPFNHGELVARVKAILRRSKPKDDNRGIITDGPISLFLEQHRLEIEGQTVDLSPKEFDLLA